MIETSGRLSSSCFLCFYQECFVFALLFGETVLKIHFSDLDKNGVRTVSTELTATPFKWDLFEVKGQLNTNRPLPKRLLKTKLAFSYRTDQVTVSPLNNELFSLVALLLNVVKWYYNGQWQQKNQTSTICSMMINWY